MGSVMPRGGDLRTLIEPAVQALKYELVDVELSGGAGQAVLRIYIDSADGINVDDCAKVSRQVSALLDVEDPIPGHYTLEVSSPGLDRPLVTHADFVRFTGALIKAKVTQPILGRRNFTGRLVEVDGDRVVVEVDNESYDLTLSNIEKARLVPEL